MSSPSSQSERDRPGRGITRAGAGDTGGTEDIAAPPPVTEEEATIPPLPPPPSEPIAPPEPHPITPPKIVEKTTPKRAEPRPKPQSLPRPARVKKPPPDLTNEAASGLRDAPTSSDEGGSKPGPRLPLPNDTAETAAGNTLGPSSTSKAEDRPPGPVEGGEAGAGNLFERGDVGVVPGSGVGGGSSAGGRSGLGLGDEGGGARVGGVDQAQEARVPVKAVVLPVCRGGLSSETTVSGCGPATGY